MVVISECLWSCFVDVAAFMDSWLEQLGYPCFDGQNHKTLKTILIGEHEDVRNALGSCLLNTTERLARYAGNRNAGNSNYSALAAQNQGALRFNTENTAHYITDYQGGVLLGQILDTTQT